MSMHQHQTSKGVWETVECPGLSPDCPPQTSVWLVTRVGQYDQGIELVATSAEQAAAFTAGFSPDHDGYHQWRITEVPLGRPFSEPCAEPGWAHWDIVTDHQSCVTRGLGVVPKLTRSVVVAPPIPAGWQPGDSCPTHPDHYQPCSKCAGANCCPVTA